MKQTQKQVMWACAVVVFVSEAVMMQGTKQAVYTCANNQR